MNKPRLIQLIKIGQKRLGWEDDIYRAWLEKHTGKRSCKDCSEAQLSMLADELRDLGALDQAGVDTKPLGGSGADRPTQRQWRTVLGLAKKCGLTGEADDPAFITFCKNIAKVESPRFLTREGISDVMVGLERWRTYQKEQKKKGGNADLDKADVCRMDEEK
jgi:hypothetical protein